MNQSKMTLSVFVLILFSVFSVTGVSAGNETAVPQEATAITQQRNAELLNVLPFTDKQSFEDAQRGFMAPLPVTVLRGNQNQVIWDPNKYAFIKEGSEAPATVNPSLWRQSQLTAISGLFKVADHIYQVRNYDLSNITFIEGDTGMIVMDPLISAETAKAALDLYYQHRPKKLVAAVIYSHSHVDHYGGVKGVVSEDDVKSGKVKIYAPQGFLEHAVAENVIAGNAMSRRASYMYGNLLPPNPKGQVGVGLGTTTSAGTVTLIPPTNIITKTGQKENIDGLEFVFKLAPNTEAPSEMFFYIPELKALTTAEDATQTLHNTYSLRGAKIRYPLEWSKYLNETIDEWGDEAEALFAPHHWPVWGKEKIVHHLKTQRDTYRYIHDQSLNLANKGYTMIEIGEMIQLPPALQQTWSSRGYYGSVNHDSKSAYALYLGWFDGNPATLHELPPVEASKKYVEYMGGEKAVMARARESYQEGEYRWVAQVMNHVVFANPENQEARELEADALEQLGYQSESGPWRNFYLSGAKELRQGVQRLETPSTSSSDTINAMTLDMLFDYMGVRLNAQKAAEKNAVLNLIFPDTQEKFVLELGNSVLNHSENKQAANADVTLTFNRTTLNKILFKQTTLDESIASGDVKVEGDKKKVDELLSSLDDFDFWFNIVTP